MKYKLLALDIDGTVVKEHTNTPSTSVVKAIQQAKKRIYISLVSARAWREQKIIVDILGLKNSYHVLENGTKVINPEGKLEYNRHLPANQVQQIIDTTNGLFDEIGFCIDNRWLKEYANPEKEIVTTLSLISKSRQKANQIPLILNRLPAKYSVTVGAHWENPEWAVTLISHKKASKGLGLSYIQKKLNVLPSQTIAVGDGASDVPTMKYAKIKVAMGNAEPELKQVANYFAPSVSDDGLVEVINKFILDRLISP